MLLVATCFVILKFIATEGVENPRSVHIALETALTFNNKDSSANVKFIDDFQNFLSKVRKKVVNKVPSSRRSYKNYESRERGGKATLSDLKFTDFIKEGTVILKNYKNDDLEDVFAVIDDEIRKYHYKGCKFYELVTDNDVRRAIANKLDLVKEKPAKDIRNILDQTLQFIEDAKFDLRNAELLDFIDSLYTRSDVEKFQKILGYFQIYQSKSKRANMDLILLLRDTIRTVIFDHFSNLNVNTRRDFKARVETYFWKNVRQEDNVQELEWTIQYNDVTQKAVQDLREIFLKPTVSKDKELSIEKDMQLTSPNKRDKSKPNNAIHLNIDMENQMDIIKSGTISVNEMKKYKPATVKSEDISVNKKKDKHQTNRELHIENNEQINSDSREESATSSDEQSISSNDDNKGYTINRYEDDKSWNAVDISSAEVDLTKKSKHNKKSKLTKPLFIDEYIAEVVRNKKSKGFTNGNIAKFANGNIGRNGNIEQLKRKTTKPKKKKYKMETTLKSKNRMHTLWEESRITKKHQRSRDEEEAYKLADNYLDDVITATEMPGNLRSRIHDEEENYRDLKSMKIKTKHRSKSRDEISIKENYMLNKIKKPNRKKDFSLNAYLQSVYPDKNRGLKFKLAAPKKIYYDEKSLRTAIKAGDEKSEEKSKDGVTSSNFKMAKSLITISKKSKLSDDSTEDENSSEFTKRHIIVEKYSKKPKQRSKQHKTVVSPTKEDTYVISSEEIITTTNTKLPKKITKSFKIPPLTPEKHKSVVKYTEKANDYSKEEEIQTTTKITSKPKIAEQSSKKQISITQKSDEKSTEKENDYTKEEEIQQTTTERPRRPKMAEQSSEKQTSTYKSVEKSIEEESHESSEEELQTTAKLTKKENKSRKKIKSATPKYTEVIEKSIEMKKETAEKEKSQKKHMRREKSSKHHTHKLKDESVVKSFEEDHSKYIDKEMLSKKPIANVEPLEERKSFLQHKKSVKNAVTDIFISIENKEHQPIKIHKKEEESKNKVTNKSFPKESTRTSKRAKYKEKGGFNHNADRLIVLPRSEEAISESSDENLEMVVNNDLPISTPTPTHRTAVPSTNDKTVETSFVTRKTYKAMDIPIKTDITGILNNKLFLRASQEIKIKPLIETRNSNESKYFRRMNLKSNFTKTTRSYLQLHDLLENYTTMTVDLNTMKAFPTTDIESVNQTYFKYQPSDFWRHPQNKFKIKTTNVTDTTTISAITTNREVTTENYITTPINIKYDDKPRLKLRRKKKRRRKTTTAITSATTPATTTIPTTNTTTTISTTTIPSTMPITDTASNYRRIKNIDVLNKHKSMLDVETAMKAYESKLEESKLDVFNKTKPMLDIETEIKAFDLKLNENKLDVFNKTKPMLDIETEIKALDLKLNENKLDVFNKSKPVLDVETATKTFESKLDENKPEDYYNYDNNTADYDKTTISEFGEDIRDFLEKHDVKLENNTDIVDIDAMNALLGPEPEKNVKPDIKSELRDEEVRRRLDKDMMKLYGNTISHITISTTPWNTLYTDPIESLNANMIGMDIL